MYRETLDRKDALESSRLDESKPGEIEELEGEGKENPIDNADDQLDILKEKTKMKELEFRALQLRADERVTADIYLVTNKGWVNSRGKKYRRRRRSRKETRIKIWSRKKRESEDTRSKIYRFSQEEEEEEEEEEEKEEEEEE
ncbi:PRKR-interacting protein 1 homolog [Palaemon carinicauda]|uniref:PRKR-interacting protein 1 homolog n=1 Tax=Palaemon carinicauda TaxID=392227 RepID=UPI0035B5794A